MHSGTLHADLLPWNVDRWLEPAEIPETLFEGDARADSQLGKAFVLAAIMNERRSLLDSK
jgi:hypothetical protein